jgi:primase-polymerase (primpol)-like protein
MPDERILPTPIPDDKPSLLSLRNESIPAELQPLRRWACWRLQRRGKDWSKVPFQPNGRHASSIDPATWSSFEEVCEAYRRGGFDGIGIFLGHGLAGVDFDKLRDRAAGTMPFKLRRWLRGLDSYTEVSPSGRGVKALCWGTLPGPGKQRACKRTKHKIEVYAEKRFFTLTGHRLEDLPDRIHHGGEMLQKLYRLAARGKALTPAPAGPAHQSSLPNGESAPDRPLLRDDEVLGLGERSKNGNLFCQLFYLGRWDGPIKVFGSQSEADMCLSGMLVYFSKDDEQCIRLFERSELWDDERAAKKSRTYVRDMIRKARANATSFYDPNYRRDHRQS